jgi:hypothetical protein
MVVVARSGAPFFGKVDGVRAGGDMQTDLIEFALLDAIAGRRARRFGLGMQLPSGPLAYTSEAEPVPLSELERSILLAAGRSDARRS